MLTSTDTFQNCQAPATATSTAVMLMTINPYLCMPYSGAATAMLASCVCWCKWHSWLRYPCLQTLDQFPGGKLLDHLMVAWHTGLAESRSFFIPTMHAPYVAPG